RSRHRAIPGRRTRRQDLRRQSRKGKRSHLHGSPPTRTLKVCGSTQRVEGSKGQRNSKVMAVPYHRSSFDPLILRPFVLIFSRNLSSLVYQARLRSSRSATEIIETSIAGAFLSSASSRRIRSIARWLRACQAPTNPPGGTVSSKPLIASPVIAHCSPV